MNLSFKDLKDPLKSGLDNLSEKAALAQHIGLILKATDPSDGLGGGTETPGYVYEELVQLTFADGGALAESLAATMAGRLSSSRSPEAKLKTLKTIANVCKRSSRLFRRSLRLNDEHLRAASDCGVGRVASSPTGAVKWQEIRALSSEIRSFLFSQELMDKDESEDPETAPVSQLSGMGMSFKRAGGKYEGFGSAPANENIGDKIVDALESFLTVTDDKKEVLEMCLAQGPTGDYKPVDIPSLKEDSMTSSSLSSMTRSVNRKHVPGRAGGGWESSDDEDEIAPNSSDKVVLEIAIEADEKERIDANIKNIDVILEDFCVSDGPVTLDKVEICFQSLVENREFEVLEAFDKKLRVLLDIQGSVSNLQIFKLLILIERLIRSTFVTASSCLETFRGALERIEKSNKLEKNVIKSQKILLTLKLLVNS